MSGASSSVASSGGTYAAEACFVTVDNDPNDLRFLGLRLVNCEDFQQVLDSAIRMEARVVLQPPPEQFRKVIFHGRVHLEDCECFGSNDVVTEELFGVCFVSPFSRGADVGIGVELVRETPHPRPCVFIVEPEVGNEASGDVEGGVGGRQSRRSRPASRTQTQALFRISPTPPAPGTMYW